MKRDGGQHRQIELGAEAIRQLAAVMVDDLHFRRLKRILELIQERLESDHPVTDGTS